MIRLHRAELLHWDIQPDQLLVLQPGVNLLTGENGSGKTSILDALKVALGARQPGGDRRVEEYLGRREEEVAMVRLVVSNDADPATGARPFDALGMGADEDLASLAVVFRAGDDGYERRYFILAGDRSPLDERVGARPFSRASDYRERLERLGLGRSFLKLVCTPQGEVASLCSQPPAALFDLLFDIIGGRDALEEWERLRRDFAELERRREDHERDLREAARRHDELARRLESHARYLAHRRDAARHRLALPLARLRSLEARRAGIDAEAVEHERRAREADEAAAAATAQRRRAEAALAEVSAELQSLATQQADAAGRRGPVHRELVRAETHLQALEALRERASGLPIRDATALTAAHDRLQERLGRCTHGRSEVSHRSEELQRELADVEAGMLKPPDAVAAFREVLRREKVPHQLLFDLLEPVEPAGSDRKALESFLGDLRFGVAVPDVDAFARAVALARREHFPYHVLAPGVRSRAPEDGERPFLDAVRVKDPRYRGLVVRLLRHVDRLRADEPVEGTYTAHEARVTADGYVVDWVGGVDRSTDRFYLGRDALARRAEEVRHALADLASEARRLDEAHADLLAERREVEARIAEERVRLEWEARREEHARAEHAVAGLADRLRRLDAEIVALGEQRVEASDGAGDLRRKAEERARRATEHEQRADESRGGAERVRARGEALRGELEEASRRAEAAGAGPSDEPAEVQQAVARLAEQPVEVLEGLLAHHEEAADAFPEADRDPGLPGNVRTMERQVADVRGELDRLAAQIDEQRAAVELAHQQYRETTRRVFRHYFARLREEAGRMRMTVEGRLRERDDGRFSVDLQVGVGDKPPVPYTSSALSGGERAALSILLGMGTLASGQARRPGFFLVDEPFSASDTHKIQELGAFLDRTGAQFVVTMPTTLDIARCGAWLRGVWTCTKTPGGYDAKGAVRLAPAVKCSYVDDA